MKVYVLFESDGGDSEVQAVAMTREKAEQWVKEKFEHILRVRGVLESDEKIDWDLLPQGWVMPTGYAYDDYSCFYTDYTVIGEGK